MHIYYIQLIILFKIFLFSDIQKKKSAIGGNKITK